MPQTAFDFTLTGSDGDPLPLRHFRGRPLLIVNTASHCAFTPRHEGLQGLWSRLRERDLTVIGVPSNEFGRHAADAGNGGRSGVGFPVTRTEHVRGCSRHPLFGWLAGEGGVLSVPRWNFFKYVIDREGRLSAWFTSLAAPDSRRVRTALERVLLDR